MPQVSATSEDNVELQIVHSKFKFVAFHKFILNQERLISTNNCVLEVRYGSYFKNSICPVSCRSK